MKERPMAVLQETGSHTFGSLSLYNIVEASWESAPVDKDPSSPLGEEYLYDCKLSKGYIYVL